jgi:hypothetical protein
MEITLLKFYIGVHLHRYLYIKNKISVTFCSFTQLLALCTNAIDVDHSLIANVKGCVSQCYHVTRKSFWGQIIHSLSNYRFSRRPL